MYDACVELVPFVFDDLHWCMTQLMFKPFDLDLLYPFQLLFDNLSFFLTWIIVKLPPYHMARFLKSSSHWLIHSTHTTQLILSISKALLGLFSTSKNHTWSTYVKHSVTQNQATTCIPSPATAPKIMWSARASQARTTQVQAGSLREGKVYPTNASARQPHIVIVIVVVSYCHAFPQA